MIVWVLQIAQKEALNAALWYEKERPDLGEEFPSQLEDALESISLDPLRNSRWEAIDSPRDFCGVRLKRFPYLVMYEILEEEVVVLAVAHASRSPGYWMHRLT